MSFSAIPLDILKNKNDKLLNFSSKVVYLTLWLKSNKEGVIKNLTKKQLGEVIGFHEDRVSKILSWLKKEGLIVVTRNGRKPNTYFLPEKKFFQCLPKTFTLVSKKIFLNKRLPIKSRFLHLVLSSYSFYGKDVKLKFLTIENLTSFSKRTITRYMLILRKAGLLQTKRRKYLCSIYTLSNEYKELPYEVLRYSKEDSVKKRKRYFAIQNQYRCKNEPRRSLNKDRELEAKYDRFCESVYSGYKHKPEFKLDD